MLVEFARYHNGQSLDCEFFHNDNADNFAKHGKTKPKLRLLCLTFN